MFSANSSQVSEDRLYVEDVFSTYLYTGNGSTQTITNGINLSGQGGLVWVKARGDLSPLGLIGSHTLYDTNRGASNALRTNGTFASASISGVTAFNSNGFGLDTNGANNASGYTYASWTFRKAPKFFDVVTWTGNNTARTISHNLGAAPGVIIVKAYSGTDASTANWAVYHRSLGNSNWLKLETTDAALTTGQFLWTSTAPTATEFSIAGGGITEVNKTGNTYVAYLFAHDTTSDGIIQCGSYTGTGSDLTVNLGWEPQWWLVKNTTTAGWSWSILDNMRGFSAASDNILQPNSSNAELTTTNISLTPTGVQYASTGNGAFNSSGATYIYIAIRRGPMRTPTSGTSVFTPTTFSGDNTGNRTIDVSIPSDLNFLRTRNSADNTLVYDRLRGAEDIRTNATDAGYTMADPYLRRTNQTELTLRSDFNNTGYNTWVASFRRAPSFFDEVCYTGTGSARTVNHNLGVAPELMIVKIRNGSLYAWLVYSSTSLSGNTVQLNKSDAAFPDNGVFWTTTAPTSTVFSLNDNALNNEAGKNFVAYLFASCPGVSKVGSYTGNGSSQTINCGFAAGARFVLIKRTDSTGDWYVWDTARGIVSGNDPHLSLNSTAAEVTTDDSVDTDSSGFVVNQLSATNINVSSATYIYLAVA